MYRHLHVGHYCGFQTALEKAYVKQGWGLTQGAQRHWEYRWPSLAQTSDSSVILTAPSPPPTPRFPKSLSTLSPFLFKDPFNPPPWHVWPKTVRG